MKSKEIDRELTLFLKDKARQIRLEIVRLALLMGEERRAHPGPALSITDIMVALYYQVLHIDPKRPKWADRDRLILSKGHACLVLYAILADLGYFSRDHLDTLRHVGSILQGHPDMRKTPGVDMTTGSLGNGLGLGVGVALAAKIDQKSYRTYVIIGDGESQEGVVWEAAQTAVRYKLDNLTAFLDLNGWQSCGSVAETMSGQCDRKRWRGFGWNVIDIDGHSFEEILDGIELAHCCQGRPTMILAHTVKGKGVSFMENDNSWHQKAPTQEQWEIAQRELKMEV
jgi:transketolase